MTMTGREQTRGNGLFMLDSKAKGNFNKILLKSIMAVSAGKGV